MKMWSMIVIAGDRIVQRTVAEYLVDGACLRCGECCVCRFYETPEEFHRQLWVMAANVDDENNPQAIYDRGVLERQQAYEFLLQVARNRGKRQEKRFKKYYRILTTFGGYRETLKYYLIVIVDAFRKMALSEARSLVNAGRLDTPEQVFDLTIKDLDKAVADPSLDLGNLAERNTRFLKKLEHVRNFPLLIDSRGKILRAPSKETKEGEIVGTPISAGIVRGRVKEPFPVAPPGESGG